MRKFLLLCFTLGFAANARADLLINGAGATFPFPLYSKWFSEYNKLHPDLKFNYQSIGSGGGIKQITEGTVDFGASDAPMTEEELAKAKDVVHIPTVLGAVVIVYNLPGFDHLKLSPQTLTGIFLGKIKNWSDPAIKGENPGLKLSDTAISVAHRSDGSGTTSIFTDYLAKVSPEWKSAVGAGKSVKWPAGMGGKGNEGVTGLVKQNPGTIGYVELAYANQNNLSTAAIKNREGAYVAPTIESTSQAAAHVNMPDDFRVSVTDATGKGAYPIAGFTYLLVHRDQKDKAKGDALLNFLWWSVHEGQKLAAPLDYAPLPAPVVQNVEAALKKLTVEGRPLHFAKS
ncbi:MAG TPA: phosphate ABC transporter substrate-binding protein PstS [Myxococcaceae bacterium]|nr:phosphate ABC transporter substrate-binding protein PstS [Myxococcaceae bacterium]